MVLVPFSPLAELLSARPRTTCVGDFNPAILLPEGINAYNSFHQSEFCNHQAVDQYKVVVLSESLNRTVWPNTEILDDRGLRRLRK